MDVSNRQTALPLEPDPLLDLVTIARECPSEDYKLNPLVRLYTVRVAMLADGHAPTALSMLDPRTRQLTHEELGCYHAASHTRLAALLCLRYAIETAIAEYEQEHRL